MLPRVMCIIVLHVLAKNGVMPERENQFCENLSRHFHSSNTSSLAFLLNPDGDETYSCLGGSMEMSCCLAGYSHIEWRVYSQPSDGTFDTWLPVILGRNSSHRLENRNQTFITDLTSRADDQRYYKCIGYGVRRFESVEGVMKLKVKDCSKIEKPTFLQPTEPVTARAVIPGDPVYLKCSLFTQNYNISNNNNKSSSNNTVVHLRWYRMQMATNLTASNFSEVSHDGRFLEITQRDPDGYIETSYLVINPTKLDDFNWYYICYTSLDNVSLGERRIQLIVKESKADHIIHLAVLIIISLSTVLVAIAVIVYRFHVEIHLFYKTRIQKSRRLEDVEYHVFLLHTIESHEDRMFVRNEIRPFLQKELKYRVFGEADFTLDQDYTDHCADGLQNSHVMVVIISRQLLEDEACKMLIRDALSTGNRIIYIVRESVSNDFESAHDILEAIKMGRKVMWLREDDDEVSTAECRVFCGLEPETQPCRETNSISHCRKKLELHLLQLLEDRNCTAGMLVLQKASASVHDAEENPIVSSDFMSQSC